MKHIYFCYVNSFTRYILFQLPGWVIAFLLAALMYHYDTINAIWATAGVLGWIIKDFILYPFVFRSYSGNEPHGMRKLIGKNGVVIRDIAPVGTIRIRGELWTARSEGGDEITSGRSVIVLTYEGHILTVKPEFHSDAPGKMDL